MTVSIIQNLPMNKKSKEILAVIVRTLLDLKLPSIRGIARKAINKRFVDPKKYSFRESLVNRIRRFFNSHKWDYLLAQLSLAQFILNRLNRKHITIHVLTDFTYLKDKWRILSFAIPIGGRAIPILAIPVSKDAFSNLEWKSEVDLLINAISLLLRLLPKGTIFTFDREFTFPKLMEFLEANGMYFVIRLKKTVSVDNKPIVDLNPGVYEGVMVHSIRANIYLKGHLNINGRSDFYAYVSNLPIFVFLLTLLNLYLIATVETDDHRVKLLKKELKEDKISFINYAMSLAEEIYSMVLKASKIGRLVPILEGIKK